MSFKDGNGGMVPVVFSPGYPSEEVHQPNQFRYKFARSKRTPNCRPADFD
jgi:hypothetical protein